MKLSELYNKRAKAWEAAKSFLDSHTNENGLMSAEDAQTYDRMEAEITQLSDQIAREQRAQEMENAMRQSTSSPILGNPDNRVDEDDKTGTASKAYNNAFWKTMRNKHVSYEITNALQVGTDTEGGHLVPDEYERTLIDGLQEENVMRRYAHIIRTASGDRKIPLVTSHGTASWIDEEQSYPESDDAFGAATLSAYKLATMIKVSEELLNDSVFNIPQYIATEFTRRIGAAEEDAFINGDGSGKPYGLLNATKGAQVGVTAASSTAITSDELIDLFYSLKAPYRRKAVWLTNDSTLKLIRKLKTSGSGEYLWQPGLVLGQPDRILGNPVAVSPYMPAATAGNLAVAFGDLSYYWIADREGRRIKRLNELFAVTGQVGFLASERTDGLLLLPEAVKALKMKP